jgi:hypothetical protein
LQGEKEVLKSPAVKQGFEVSHLTASTEVELSDKVN